MKKLSFIFSLILFAVIFSCKNPCKKVHCQNGGTCDEGDCVCAQFYEGTECETETRSHFIGQYAGTTSSGTSSWPDTAELSYGSGPGVINMGCLPLNLTSATAFTMNDGTACGFQSISGSGTLENGTNLSFHYTAIDGGTTYTVAFAGIKF